MDRDALFARVEHNFANHVVRVSPDPHGMCLYWAAIGLVTLAQEGIDAIMQAGTASWPSPEGRIVFPFDENGPEWTPGVGMTDIHVWLGIPTTREIVDFSIKALKADVLRRHNMRLELPDYLWFAGRTPYQYVANQKAIRAAYWMLRNSVRRLEDMRRQA